VPQTTVPRKTINQYFLAFRTSGYRSTWLAQDITNAASIPKTFVQRGDDAHDEGVTEAFLVVFLVLVNCHQT
jgi:hypothetical protein